MSPQRIALIGLGDIAQKAYLPILARHPEVEPVLCTRNAAVLKQLATQYRIRETYTQLDDLIAAPPNAAMVHSATDSHAEIVTALLRADIPVFVDKPLTYSLAESEKLLRLAADRKLPLMAGFNRRYAPLVRDLRREQPPRQISWHKNRVDLPGDVRTFVFDDFIHVVDGLRFLAPGPVEDLSVHCQMQGDQLANLQLRWRSGDTLLTGGMNRVSGRTEEHIDYYTTGHKWTIHDLHAGLHFHGEKRHDLTFSHWTPTLEKRGFVDMINDWIATVRTGGHDASRADEIRQTHALCETIVRRIESRW